MDCKNIFNTKKTHVTYHSNPLFGVWHISQFDLLSLTYCSPMLFFYTPWKHQKVFRLLSYTPWMCLNYCLSLAFSLVQSSVPICVIAFGIIEKVLLVHFSWFMLSMGYSRKKYNQGGGLRIYLSEKANWNI